MAKRTKIPKGYGSDAAEDGPYPMNRSGCSKPLILILAHEAALATMLRDNLEKQGFRTEPASDGEQGLTHFAQVRPDMVLLDWMFPDTSGIEVCRQIRRRATHALPIIIMSAYSEDRYVVQALNAGADDCVTKPIRMDELLARMRASLRRAGMRSARGQLTFHDLTMDVASHRVLRNGRALHLRPTEFRLLELLLEHPRHVLSRERLRDALWGPDTLVAPRTVDVLIRRLRKAIHAPGESDLVRTVRTAGYALDIGPP